MSMKDHLPRKLAAILYADVAGYSRLTGADEDATHRTLSKYLDLISSSIESNRGQIMHYAGDAVLAKFGAVVDAMSAAVDIQNELRTRNEGVPGDRRVQFRIGVNLGDVIEDRGDIYGDGVNVAARLEGLADSGGICISDAVRRSIGKKLDLDYDDMGEQEVKNIEEPIRAYKVMVQGRDESVDASPMAGQIRKIEMDRARGRTAPGSKVPLEYTFLGEQEVKNTKNPVRPYQVKLKTDTALQRPSGTTSVVRPAISIIGILAVIIAAGTLFWFKPWNVIKDPDSTEPTLFNKPSIAVLPFHNLSDDPEQEHFSDGLTTDIITDLSKFSSLFVIAANSTFRYKGQAVNVQSVGEELGAHSARLSI